MHLSEAIWKGSKLRPQGFGKYYTAAGGSCAWGAAFEGARCGILVPHLSHQRWPVVGITSQCPLCKESNTVANLIVHLNDDHLWTREAIGLWVGRMEEMDAAPLPESLTEKEMRKPCHVGA